MGCKVISVLVLTVFFLGLASASFSYLENGSSITTQYEPSDYLNASINISFNNQSLSSNFTDSLGHRIGLGALLNLVPGYHYSFSDITNTTINSAYQPLALNEADFQMPSSTGNFTYQLNLSGFKVFEKIFQMMSTNSLVQETIEEKTLDLEKTKTDIKTYDLFVQSILNEYLNITSIESQLQEIETDYEDANTPAEYTAILNRLANIKIPIDISESVNTNSVSFYPDREQINLDIVKNIGGGNYSENEEGYIDAIYSWNDASLKTSVTFREILINYGSNQGDTLRIFRFEFDRRNMQDEAYFIIKKLENLKFKENYLQTEESEYFYINLENVPDSIIFSTTEELSFFDVPAFISPSLTALTLPSVGPYEPFKPKTSKWILFGLILFLLLLIGSITYITLQMWYRRKYENYLFKNRNNLFNIMTYIQNAKKKGMPRDDIVKNLKKASWTREQISYAMQKYEKKKIAGIIERPFKKVIEEIEKKPSDVQKRPSDIHKKP